MEETEFIYGGEKFMMSQIFIFEHEFYIFYSCLKVEFFKLHKTREKVYIHDDFN